METESFGTVAGEARERGRHVIGVEDTSDDEKRRALSQSGYCTLEGELDEGRMSVVKSHELMRSLIRLVPPPSQQA